VRCFLTRPGLAAIMTTAIALAFTVPAKAGPILLGTWYEFGFGTAGTPATGCDPADPSGGFCISSSGTPTTFLDAPPWTFQAPVQGAILLVTDAFLAGDRFQVFDFGASRGLTSAPSGSADCGDDPVPCLAIAGISKGSFVFASGNHSLTITPTLSGGGGAAYFRVDAVPEPSAWILLGGGLALIGLFRRRLRYVAERGSQ
jgi:PEP-CTERM motif